MIRSILGTSMVLLTLISYAGADEPSDAYGGGGGNNFTDSSLSANSKISRIRVKSGTSLDAIEFQSNAGSLGSHGGDGGQEHLINISEDEYLYAVEMTYGSRVDSVVFVIKNSGNGVERRTVRYGNEGPNRVTVKRDGSQIVGAHGRSGSMIDSLGFVFREL